MTLFIPPFGNIEIDVITGGPPCQSFSLAGERKKNEILQMKILEPKFIILDELDSGLDVDSLKIVCQNINNYKKDNPDTSILMITHYPKILEYIKPNYVHMMKDGTIIETGDISLAKRIEENGYNVEVMSDKDE